MCIIGSLRLIIVFAEPDAVAAVNFFTVGTDVEARQRLWCSLTGSLLHQFEAIVRHFIHSLQKIILFTKIFFLRNKI